MSLRTLFAVASLMLAGAAAAATPAPPGVRVEHAWIRWLPAGLPQAGYAEIVNDSAAGLTLTGVTSPAYGMVMLHRSRLAHGDSTMEMVDTLDIPAHTSVNLAPGGYHLMLMHATRTLQPGDTVKITFAFAGGATLQVEFPVLPANSTGPAD